LRMLGWAFGSAPETVASRNCGIVAKSPISMPPVFYFLLLTSSFRNSVPQIVLGVKDVPQIHITRVGDINL
jgi:hypothetical protein